MSKDFALDPVTLDLVDADDGWFEEDETAGAAVVSQLTHHFDAWVVDPTAGSELHQLWDFGGDAIGAEGLRAEAVRALHVLEEAGLIEQVEATASSPANGAVAIETSYRDTATGARIDQEAGPPPAPGGS